jgi:hypothetical protein
MPEVSETPNHYRESLLRSMLATALRREASASRAVRSVAGYSSAARALGDAMRVAQIEVDALGLLLDPEQMPEARAIEEYGDTIEEQLEGARGAVKTDAEVGAFGPERFGGE